MNLASLGLSMEEGKTILAAFQTNMVTLQVERHGQAGRCCAKYGRRLRNKGHYRSTFRSVYGNVPVQVRRVTGCRDCGEKPATPLFTRKSSTAPELRYLNAKLAALLPYGKVAEFLNEVLPATTGHQCSDGSQPHPACGWPSIAGPSQTGQGGTINTARGRDNRFGWRVCEESPTV